MKHLSIFSSNLLNAEKGNLKGFLKKSAQWFFGCLFILLGVHFWIDSVPLVRLDEKFYVLEKKLEDIEVLILGNSQTECTLISNEVGLEAYNMAMVSQDLFYDIKIIEKYLSEMKNLKYIVWGISWFSPVFDMSKHSMHASKTKLYFKYFKTHHNNERVLDHFESRVSFLRIQSKDPFKNVHKLLARSINKNADDWQENPYVDVQLWPKHQKMFDNTQIKIDFAENLPKDIKAYENNKNILIEKIKLLNEKGVKVILFTPPCSKKYSEKFPVDVKKKFKEFLNSIIEKVDVKYFDYSDCFSGEEYFFDTDHVNEEGARLFTKKFKEHLN